MAREDKGNVMSSYEENNKGGEDQPSSLSARRARLRGSLAKAMPDPYSVASANQGAPNVNGATADAAAAPPPDPANYGVPPADLASTLTPASPETASRDNGNPVMNQIPANGNAHPATDPQTMPAPALTDNGLTNGGGNLAAPPTPEYSPAFSGVSDLASAITQASDNTPVAPLTDHTPAHEMPPIVAAPLAVSPHSSFVGLPAVTPPPMPLMPDLPSDLPSSLSQPGRIVSFSTNDSQTLDLLGSMDQAMNICAMNLSSLQKMAGEQTDALKVLSDTLKNQTFSELGLSLNSLMESLSAALEPMKAVGELVPAIDQLVSAFESKNAQATEPKLNSEQLVMSLADQLSSGAIDPWTFKCAYMAIFPSEHPADLLHRLVDLLGTQRLSGELFRSAYDAVQAAEPPPLPMMPRRRRPENEGEEVTIIQDDALLAEIEQLRVVQEELQRKDKLREEELAALVSSKEKELHDAQEQLNDRWQEFTGRYDELTNTLQKRDEALQERESELAQRSTQLAQKDTENQVLKHQIEELREQTQEMVKELQKQLNETKAKQDEIKAQPAKPAPGFFDVAPGQDQPPTLFDNGPARPLFQQQMHQAKAEAQRETGPQSTLNNPGQLNPANGQSNEAPKAQQPQMGSPNPVPVNQQAMPQGNMPQPPQGMPQNMPQGMPQGVPQNMPQNMPQGMPLPGNQGPISQQIPQAPPANGQMPVSNQAIPTSPSQGQMAQQQMPRPPVPGPNTFVPGSGSYGTGVRAQVFEVIVRQALAGAPWKEICAGPMQVNNISPDEVEQEVKRRQALLKK